jgi:hypothetical protein
VRKPVPDCTDVECDRVVGLNLKGILRALKAFVRTRRNSQAQSRAARPMPLAPITKARRPVGLKMPE